MQKGILLSVLLMGSVSMAAIPSNVKKGVKPPSSILRTAGAIHGGQAGSGFSLLAVQSQVAKTKKLERVTVAVGNGALQKQLGSPGYFQIENSPEQKRVVINFTQTLNAAFNEATFQKQFAQSPFVKSSQLLFEPQGQTMSLVLHVRKPVSIRAIPVAGTQKQTARLVVDIFEDSLLNQKPKATSKTK